MRPHYTETEYAAAFWRKVRMDGHPRGCWEWTASKNEHGYGRVHRGGVFFKAHRESLRMFGVMVPHEQLVLHECDNPSCVNPSHLTLGSQLDNMKSCRERGRSNRGERNGMAYLTEDQVREIRRRFSGGDGQASIAASMGLGRSAVLKVCKNVRWRHVV